MSAAATAAAVVLATLLAAASAWPFDASPPKLPAKPSLWQLLLSDHATLGFVRLAFVVRIIDSVGLTAEEREQFRAPLEDLKRRAAETDPPDRAPSAAPEAARALLLSARKASVKKLSPS